MSGGQEFFHQIRHAAQQQMGEQRWFHIGHISTYDPNTSTVTVVLPVMRGSAEDGRYMVSPRIPFGSPWVGPAFGFQCFPRGGSTPEDPTIGEQVIVDVLEKSFGAMVVSASLYNQTMPPPNIALPSDKKLRPGEAILRHASGAFLRFHADGKIEVSTEEDGDIEIISKRDIKLKADGKIDIEAVGDVTVKADKVILDTEDVEFKKDVTIKGKDITVECDDAEVNCKNAKINASGDIFGEGTNIAFSAAETLELHGNRVWIDGRDIVIGNENNTLGSTNTNTIRIDGVRTRMIGRITNKVIGTKISIGSVDGDDGFNANRIDIIADRGG